VKTKTPRSIRRALVTGASSGIGYALSLRLAARGIEVWVSARRAALLDKLVAEITAAGGKAHALTLDVSRGDETAQRLAGLDAECGGIDLVVANAGVGGERGGRTMAESNWEDTRDMLTINLLGTVATVSPFIKPMVARGHGHIVGISSLSARSLMPRGQHYGASKAGMSFFLRALDIELRPLGVPVTVVEPGFMVTPMSDSMDARDPQPFRLSLARAVRLIERAIDRQARLIRFPWQLHALTGFANLLPFFLYAPIMRRATRPRISR
jgi:short-subunit dehydrogenase